MGESATSQRSKQKSNELSSKERRHRKLEGVGEEMVEVAVGTVAECEHAPEMRGGGGK